MKKIIFLSLAILYSTICFGAVATIPLEGDPWDAYTDNGTEVVGSDIVAFGFYNVLVDTYDGYWAFPIPDTIYNGTIDSIKLSFYITTAGREDSVRIYGLLLEDCDTIENIDLSAQARTIQFETQGLFPGVRQCTTVDFDTVFQEWVDSFAHVGTDHFGMVIDNYACISGDNYDLARDYSHASYSNNTYLIIWYTPAVPEEEEVYDLKYRLHGGKRGNLLHEERGKLHKEAFTAHSISGGGGGGGKSASSGYANTSLLMAIIVFLTAIGAWIYKKRRKYGLG